MSITGTFRIKQSILKGLKENPEKVTHFGSDKEILLTVMEDEFELSNVVSSQDMLGVGTVTHKGKVWRCGKGVHSDCWCVFTKGQIEKYFDKVDDKKSEEFYTITFGPNHTSCSHGPFTEEKAKEFALSQKRNGVDGVRVIVLKQIAEAFVNYEVR